MDLIRQLASGQLGTSLHADNYAAFLQTLAGFAHVAPSNKASDNAKYAPHAASSLIAPR